jgi:NAD(P)-dependent dehydrogenase (short-subunit alcohol dehydrogenase family)
MTDSQVVIVTGASSGFGEMIALALADAGHNVYATLRDAGGRNAPAATNYKAYARQHRVEIQPLELDVTSQPSVDQAVRAVLQEEKRVDAVVHNAGHMVFGPSEAFTPEQLADQYDVNVLGTQRVNRAVLPILRRQGRGLLVWISSSSTRGGTPPYLGPYFAAKAGMDALAVCYASEVARWGVETSIIVPGAFTTGTKHFEHAGKPADASVLKEYETGATRELTAQVQKGFAATAAPDADPTQVARAVVSVFAAPFGKRPFRVHVDPADDGAIIVNPVADRMRIELLRRMGLEDLLHPAVNE